MRDDEFEELFSAHASDLLGFLVYRTGDRGLSEDLLADTFERVLRSRRRFDPRRGSAKNWLYTIALNLLRDHGRRAGVEARLFEPATDGEERSDPDPELERVADRDMLARAIAELSPEEREAVALRFGGDLTSPEIAKLLGEKLTTVEGRVYRALGKLRDRIGAAPEPEREGGAREGR